MSGVVGKIRAILAIEGTPIGVRIVPHKTDPNLIVLKNPHMEVLLSLCAEVGITVVSSWQGSNYGCVAANQGEFLERLPVLFKAMLETGENFRKMEVQKAPVMMLVAPVNLDEEEVGEYDDNN